MLTAALQAARRAQIAVTDEDFVHVALHLSFVVPLLETLLLVIQGTDCPGNPKAAEVGTEADLTACPTLTDENSSPKGDNVC